jgi:Tfp pilus assembly protein PilF
MKTLTCLACTVLLAACGVAPVAPPVPEQILADQRFAPPAQAIEPAEVFALSPAMKQYAHSPELTRKLRENGLRRGLIDALYDKGQLGLEYDSVMTRNAAEAFEARAGNCLSLVIMTSAFARELGIEVQFQRVLTEETWGRSGDLYLALGHVNLTLGKQRGGAYSVRAGYEALTVDFVPGVDLRNQRVEPISEATILAMYMNNRAAEMLARGDTDAAYWWARAAVRQDPGFLSAYNTLGVIYQRHGDAALAEQVFSLVLGREPANTQALSNLALLLSKQGRHAEAHRIKARLAQLQPEPPFSYFNRGLAAMGGGDFKAAKHWFGKEIDRAPDYHEFHFWMAQAHYALGELRAARAQMALALENTTTRKDRDLYAAKLDRLNRLYR